MATNRGNRRLLLIGWDAADWKVINPIMDAGLMPALSGLVNNGVIANLATLDPPLSPMLWTSIATGMTADQHGVLGFVQPDPESGGLKPVLGSTRKVRALWNILSHEGLDVNVVGWWPSHPAEPISGVMVSNFFQPAVAELGEPWPVPKGAVHPPEIEEELARLRVHPAELTGAHVGPFVPDLAKIDQEKDQGPGRIANILGHAATVQAVATWIMRRRDWDFMAVYYDAIDHFAHGFMRFHPPKQRQVPDDMYRLYKNVVTASYMFHDMMLQRLLELAGPNTTVILLSDHGFRSDHLRLMKIPREPAGPAGEHRNLGVLCMTGPGIRKDERIYGAGLLDITPTVLHLFGLPVGHDMRGKVLTEAFEQPGDPSYIDSWETVEGDFFMHPDEALSDPWAEGEMMRQLIDLGYIEEPDEEQQRFNEQVARETRFYLARVFATTGRVEQAVEIFEQIVDEDPDNLRYAVWLINAYLTLSRLEDARGIVEGLQARFEGLPPRFDELVGSLLLAEGRSKEALDALRRAEKAESPRPLLHTRIGQAYLKLGQPEDAERAFRRALTIDIDSAEAHFGLAAAAARKKDWFESADAALQAVARRFFFPAAHFRLGTALMHLGEYERAAEALEVCVSQAPGMKQARLLLSEIYRNFLDKPKEAQKHLTFAEERIRPANPQTESDT